MKKKVLGRKDVPVDLQWDLTKIYRNTEAWEADFQAAAALLEKLRDFRGRLAQSGQMLLAAFKAQEALGLKLDRLYVYAKMKLDEDNRLNLYQGLRDRAQSLGVSAGETMAFFQPEILSIPGERLEEMIGEEPQLEEYRRLLEDIARFKPHTLSQKEEELLAMTGEIGDSPQNIFSLLNHADMVFPEIMGEEGAPVRITHGNYISLLESKDRAVRAAAFKGLYETYGSFRNTIGASLAGSVKKDVFYAKARQYPSALQSALFDDNIPQSLYDNLIAAVRAHLGLFHRYLALRKQALGLDELHMYDLYTPLTKPQMENIGYDEAFAIVLAALKPMGEEYLSVLRRAKDERWIDVMENAGKTSGAYSWGTYDTNPYVLLNHQNNLQSVFTIAHELGHSLHSYFTWKTQPYQYGYYKIFVAEVASTVNESLLTFDLLEKADNKAMRIFLLNQYLEEFRGTVFRQTMFAEFEKIIHGRAEAMESLTADDFCEIYYGLNKDYFGSGVVIDDEIRLEWARIPHFYNGFYVYKYATGFSAAAVLSRKIFQREPGAVEAYLQFLSSGSSDYPNELLKKAGVDLTDPATLDSAFKSFDERLTELEGLLAE